MFFILFYFIFLRYRDPNTVGETGASCHTFYSMHISLKIHIGLFKDIPNVSKLNLIF